jgi:phosphoglycerol transferase MdoB-like AlkP superfamily enzyme
MKGDCLFSNKPSKYRGGLMMKFVKSIRNWFFETEVYKRVLFFMVNEFEVFLMILVFYSKAIYTQRYTNSPILEQAVVSTACLGSALVIAGLMMPIKKNYRFFIILGFNIVISLLLFADVVYYRYYSNVLTVPVLFQSKLMGDGSLLASIKSLIDPKDIFLFIDIVVLIGLKHILTMVKNKYNIDDEGTGKIKKAVFAVLLVSLGLMFTTRVFIEAGKLKSNNTFKKLYDSSFIISNIGILNFHIFDGYIFLMDALGNSVMTEEDKIETKESIENLDEEVFTDSPLFSDDLEGSQEGKNLIVIQMEAFQNFLIDKEFNGQEVTPYLNDFKERCMYFDNFYSQTAAGNTSDAEMMLNNSLYPVTEGSVYFRYSTNIYDSLPSLFKEKGYDTFSMHAYKASFWNRSMMHPLQGFNRFYSRRDYELDDLLGRWGLSDESFFRQNLEIFEEKKDVDEPFYSFIISLSSHYPYEGFDDYDEIDTGEYEGTIVGKYVEAIHYADQVFGETLNSLEEMGYLDDSVIVMYGDHEGIKSNEPESFAEELEIPDNKDIFKYQMKEVPLFIHFPDDEHSGVYNKLCGQIDLMPTIANLFGIESEYTFGMDMINQSRNYLTFATNNIITKVNKIYINRNFTWYDMSTGEEVEETSDLAKYVEEANNEISTSNNVLQYNLLEDFLNKTKNASKDN